MSKDDRSGLNPFTGKSHYDTVNDDKFLKECYDEYYKEMNKYQILDHTSQGQLILKVASNLINAVENYLSKIGRSDYTADYYDWEVHLVQENSVNAFCIPGGKIAVYSGILEIADTEETIAFILGHEMAHALLDHSRTESSVRKTKNTITTLSRIGSIGLMLLGEEELGLATNVVTNIADIGSELFLIKPFGRSQEIEADKLGMMIIHWAGYDIHGIPSFWEAMSAESSNNFDFLSTHPSDDKRIAAMNEMLFEIENQRDFYSQPVLSDASGQSSGILEKIPTFGTPTATASGMTASKPTYSSNTCSNCGTIVRPDDIFCINCGNKLKLGLKCDKCGNPVKEDDAFCTNCGHKLTKELKCSNCGTSINEEDSFCFNCGNKI
ncbi:M48 family metallopeptidase [uncultured Methanobrevibacter sp.]|uniref:M48 family metallopeptidase n=1 Tax=uncultured Methanobrevibacter sp. TaxID=253161 RepID=UPI002618227E|nr:M48 family metallopeptidase [uncultured Methanobrevibacter sp.]